MKRCGGILGSMVLMTMSLLMVDCIHNDSNEDTDSQQPSINVSVDERIRQRSPGVDGSVTYDSDRDVMVFAGGSPVQTWEWSDNQWRRKTPSNRPPRSSWLTCRYFPDIGQTVLLCFREESSAVAAEMEMWLYDGLDWRKATVAGQPQKPGGELMYDAGNKRLLYTGIGFPYYEYSYAHDDCTVHAFDGSQWSILGDSADLNVSLRIRSLGFDEARGRIVLSGYYLQGYDNTTSGTWEFDGQQWTVISNLSMGVCSMVYDRFHQRLLAIRSQSSVYAHVQASTTVSLYSEGELTDISTTYGIAVSGLPAWHDGLDAVFAYQPSSTMIFDTDEVWREVGDTSLPGNNASPHAVFWPSQGGTFIVQKNKFHDYRLETWFWDGDACSLLNTSDLLKDFSFPKHALMYDPAKNRLLLYAAGQSYYNDYREFRVWESDHWAELQTIGLSPGMHCHIEACPFPPRGSIIFNGWSYDASGIKQYNTWELKDDQWTVLELADYPPVRFQEAMVFDENRQVIVLFGGCYSVCFNDTWEFDGTNWREIDTLHAPSFRADSMMVYDPGLKMIVLVGGQCLGEAFRDVWAYDGNDWQLANVNSTPIKRVNPAIAYDAVRNKIILWGGQDGDTALGSLLELTTYR